MLNMEVMSWISPDENSHHFPNAVLTTPYHISRDWLMSLWWSGNLTVLSLNFFWFHFIRVSSFLWWTDYIYIYIYMYIYIYIYIYNGISLCVGYEINDWKFYWWLVVISPRWHRCVLLAFCSLGHRSYWIIIETYWDDG